MQKQIRVLYVTPHFKVGGTESQVFLLASRLDRSRFKAFVISVGEDSGQRLEYEKIGIEARHFALRDIFKMVSFARTSGIDIIHSFYYGDWAGWEAVVARFAGVKVLITSRRNMGYWRRPRHAIFDTFRNFFTDLVVANSKAVLEKAVADERLKPSKTAVIYNGVDIPRYAGCAVYRDSTRKDMGLDPGDKLIGMIGNVKAVKGYDHFLRAAKIIKDADKRARFIIAGKGSDGDVFKRKVEGEGLQKETLLMGQLADAERILSAIDIFMYSSVSEGFPNVLLEAMAVGKPIVSTEVGGIGEMIENTRSGLLVSPGDAQALADAVIGLLSSCETAKRLGKAAEERVRRYFSMEGYVKKHEDLYSNLYDKRN